MQLELVQWCVDHTGPLWSAGVMDEERNDDGDEDSGTGHGVTDQLAHLPAVGSVRHR